MNTPALVANTDKQWFDHFRPNDSLTVVDEVNFWRPLAQHRFRVLSVGEPLFFRLKHPYSAVAGFGFFAGEFALTINMAWEVFAAKNGDLSYERFVSRIREYRQRLGSRETDPAADHLSCLILRDAVFLPEADWLPWGLKQEWSKNLVTYKSYDLNEAAGRKLRELMQGIHPPEVPDLLPDFVPVTADTRTKREVPMFIREGQGTFRLRVCDAYGWKCAVTGERAVPVLEAAHIQSYLGPESNHIQNGLALRADLHRLYDAGYITVTEDLRVEVSQSLKEEFDNGKQYYKMAGSRVLVPKNPSLRPSEAALRWHSENLFR
jgi:HNH endonuclease